MEVSPNALRKETVQVLSLINEQIDAVKQAAAGRGITATKLVDDRGNFVLPPLLLAKSSCLNTLTLLNEQGKRPIRGEATRR